MSYEIPHRWIVTFRYPLEPLPPPKELRGRPIIDPNLCIGCGACVRACPPNAITEEINISKGIKVVKIFYGRCIFCGRCWEVCPEGAIRLSNEFELATPNKDDLIQYVVLPLHKCVNCGKPTEFTERQVVRVLTMIQELPIERREELRSKILLCRECKASFLSKPMELRGSEVYEKVKA